MNQEEHNLQCACVKWFAYAHPELRGLLFAIPNGGERSKATAGKLKAEGVVAGVADLILLVPQWFTTWRGQQGCKFAGLCIEMKTKQGYQSPEQKAWQAIVEQYGYKYAVCRSIDQFIETIENYLKP